MLTRFFARRYLFSPKSRSVINVIAGVSVLSFAMPVAAMIVLLSVLNGFGDFAKSMSSAFDADLTVAPREGQTFASAEIDSLALTRVKGVGVVSYLLEQQVLLERDGLQTMATLRGVDDRYTEVFPIEETIPLGSWSVRTGDLDRLVLGRDMARTLGIRSLVRAEVAVYALRRGNTNESLEHIGTVLLKVFDRLKELSESGSDISGLSTGLRDLDKFINGLNRSDLVLLAARPGMGKTSMALNVALNVAKKNPQKTVAFFSLEMSKEQLVTRLISNESFVDNKKLVTGQLSMEEWSKIGIAATALSQTDIRVDDNPSLSVAEMNAKCRRLDNLCLVIIDYLQLMVSAGGRSYSGENRQQVVSDISRSLKIMAKELNVPVLCLSQLSRANESRQDKRPLLSDLRESGAIEQDADEVMFLYREDYYNKDTPEQNVAECIVAKNRHGETGTVKLQWLPQFTTFADREWRHDEG